MKLDWILVEEHADTGTTLWRDDAGNWACCPFGMIPTDIAALPEADRDEYLSEADPDPRHADRAERVGRMMMSCRVYTATWRARREQEASASAALPSTPAAPVRGPVWPFPPQPMDYPCLPPAERPVRAPAPSLADIPAAPF